MEKTISGFATPVGKAFAPNASSSLEPFIKEVATSLVDAFIDDHQAEMLSQLLILFPLKSLSSDRVLKRHEPSQKS